MVHFNELRIDGKKLIIDVSVLSETYYKDVYLDSIVIDNQDTFVSGGPSSNPIFSYSVPDEESKLRKRTFSPKHTRLILDGLDVNTSDMLFVYVRTKGAPTPDTPCGLDNITTMGTVVDMQPFYNKAMGFVKELANNCSVPQGFSDYILKLKALELSVKTGNYIQAIEYFKKFFKGSGLVISRGGCGCGSY